MTLDIAAGRVFATTAGQKMQTESRQHGNQADEHEGDVGRVARACARVHILADCRVRAVENSKVLRMSVTFVVTHLTATIVTYHPTSQVKDSGQPIEDQDSDQRQCGDEDRH